MCGPTDIFWTDRHTLTVEDVTWDDFPWVVGRLVTISLTPELRRALEWLARMAEADTMDDPPFDESLLDGWCLRGPDGRMQEISPPLVDFEAETVTWR